MAGPPGPPSRRHHQRWTWPGCCSTATAPGTLPGSAFGEPDEALRLRLATGLLYGENDEQQEAALAAADPLALPWIAAELARLEEILADLAP